MLRLSALFSFLFSVFLISVVSGQTLTVGALSPNPNLVINPYPAVLTAVSGTPTASATGTVTHAVFDWSASPCPRAAKIKFLRADVVGGARPVPVDVVVAERGPFDVTAPRQSVFLSPPVDVQAGDRIALAAITSCGFPAGESGTAGIIIVHSADLTGVVTPGISHPTVYQNSTLSVQATGVVGRPPLATDPAAIIPVVGSTAGVGGALFRSAVQLHNSHFLPVSGRLLFHPQGFSGSTLDPTLSYVLQPGETKSIPDLLRAMNLSGLGSLDIVPDGGLPPPVVAVRVFNDGGVSGTTGFTEELVLRGEALGPGQKGTLIAPSDPVAFRFNIGVRTLATGATLAITVRTPDGVMRRNGTRSYPPNYMEQTSAGQFTTPVGPAVFPPLEPNESVTVEVMVGRAIVYGAVMDNVTNDPSLQVARAAE
jgi:hypothetical protein